MVAIVVGIAISGVEDAGCVEAKWLMRYIEGGRQIARIVRGSGRLRVAAAGRTGVARRNPMIQSVP